MERKEREIADMKGSYDAVIQKMNNDHTFALDQGKQFQISGVFAAFDGFHLQREIPLTQS